MASSAAKLVNQAITETAPVWDDFVQRRQAYCKSQQIPPEKTAERSRCLGHAAKADKIAQALKRIVVIQGYLETLLAATEPDVDALNLAHMQLLAALPDVFRPWVLAGNGICLGSCSHAAALWP